MGFRRRSCANKRPSAASGFKHTISRLAELCLATRLRLFRSIYLRSSRQARKLSAVRGNPGEIIAQLSGEAGVPYVLQTSYTQGVWVNVSTNRLTGNSINLTNAILPAPSLQLFRAVWLPKEPAEKGS